ncbi:MAG: hypothetical protein ACK4K3_01310 [Aquabacterium sp.]|jgi:hypothetical protein
MPALHTDTHAPHIVPGTSRRRVRARATSCALVWAAAQVMLGLWTSPASAVYRCGGVGGQAVTYSQWPCGEAAQALNVADPRTDAQRADAQRAHAVAEQEAARLDRRLRREARQRQREKPTAIDGPVRQVSAGDDAPKDSRRARRLKAEAPERVIRPERPFRALLPKAKKSAQDRSPR